MDYKEKEIPFGAFNSKLMHQEINIPEGFDTFIEKACMKLKKLMYDNLMFQGRLHREEVVDNFVEDFKNYLELNSFS